MKFKSAFSAALLGTTLVFGGHLQAAPAKGNSDAWFAVATKGGAKDLKKALGKININQANKDGETALHLAASAGNVEGVKFLLSKKANANALNASGASPLMEALFVPGPEGVKAGPKPEAFSRHLRSSRC